MTTGGLASRNRRWMQMRDELRMTIAEIAFVARKTRRTIQEGIRAARRALKVASQDTHPEAPPDAHQLTAHELGSLARTIKGNLAFQTPEVLEWMATQRSDRRRPARPDRD